MVNSCCALRHSVGTYPPDYSQGERVVTMSVTLTKLDIESS